MQPGKDQSVTHPAILLWFSIAAIAYFMLMNLIGAARVDFPVIGAIIELCTIPMLLLTLGCFFFSLLFWIREGFRLKSRMFYSFLLSGGLITYFILAQ